MIAGTGLSPAVWGEPRGFQEFDLLQTVQLAEPVTAVLAAVLSECAGAVRRKSLLVEIAPVTCCNVPSWGFMRDTPLFRTVSHCFRTISSVVVDLVSLPLDSMIFGANPKLPLMVNTRRNPRCRNSPFASSYLRSSRGAN